VNDAVASEDVVVEFLQRTATGDDEIFLYGDVERWPLEVLTEQFAVAEEFAADRGEKKLLMPGHVSPFGRRNYGEFFGRK
jgi:hypothetical protein